MTTTFADRLHAAIEQKGNPVCVGIDPISENIPNRYSHPGGRYPVLSMGNFVSDVLWAVAPLVPVVKFQSAYFELYGSDGVEMLEEMAKEAKRLGLLTIFDGKRGDIGPTSKAYAEAYLKNQEFDAMTLSPYLGTDSLAPFAEVAAKHQKGLFVCVRTSNPGSSAVQLWSSGVVTTYGADGVARSRDAGFLYEGVARMVEDLGWGAGPGGYSDIGMVVGATQAESAAKLRKEHPTSLFLVPGVGAQGGSLDTAAACFNYHGHGNVPYGGAIVNNSRALLYPEKYGTGDNVADATKRFAEQLHHRLSTRRS